MNTTEDHAKIRQFFEKKPSSKTALFWPQTVHASLFSDTSTEIGHIRNKYNLYLSVDKIPETEMILYKITSPWQDRLYEQQNHSPKIILSIFKLF